MRSPLSGSIATFVVFVPLVAVPLLAVLGMPQMSASSPMAVGDDLKFAQDEHAQMAGNAELANPVRVSDSPDQSPALNHDARIGAKDSDPFAAFSRDSDGDSPAKRPQRWPDEGNGQRPDASLSSSKPNRAPAGGPDQPRPSDPFADQTAQPSANEASDRTPTTRRGLPEAEAVVALRSDAAADAAASGAPASLSSNPRTASRHASAWKQAVGRLNALGIRDFQLQPGEREGDFNFSCLVASPSNPRVVHRFEAESADPLDAVNQVLRQLEDWRTRRIERKQAARNSAADGRLTSRASESSEIEMTNRAF